MENISFGQLPAIRITAPDGASAVVTLYGGHLVSWHGADGGERMFLSSRSALDGSRAIRGGVPVIFPQFGERGDGMRHGFARLSTWRLEGHGIEGDTAWAEFGLNEADLAPAMAAAWPHRFALTLRVTVQANALEMALGVRNAGAAPFPFAAALHTYHLVPHLADVRIEGLEAGTLSIADKLDVVYENVAGNITLGTWARVLTLEQAGFKDAVVWNPGAADTAALADMEDDEYQRFVCIEPAQLSPVELAPGAVWEGRYRIS
ncbi:D-hexose-6-phosphate mutarotase [Massilia arenae]|uniref:glucose-6-phosphate 1-epimerase n=1 Tax=Massilia arenae TaxID=2603288 RepID=A0A5C7G7T4_9BURK|nr:D-hexose-6-phosphate mutarotase [Massilia arenae]TXG02061.1 D-hexose-6-phosphate mutarotase [Massilia arenae]